MKKNAKWMLAVGLCLAMIAGAGCAAKTPDPTQAPAATAAPRQTQEPAKLSGTLEVGGSTSVQPLMEALADAFMNENDGVEINVQGGGSGVGIASTADGLFEIGMSSRSLKDEEKAKGLKPVTIALDGIAVTVNAANPVNALTTEQIQKIFKGEITSWSQVGGSDAPIVVYTREAASGTRGAFLELMKLQDDEDKSLITDKALEANSNGSMKTNIAGNANAIGYISLGSVDDTVKAVDVDSVKASVDTVLDGTYPVKRPFLVVTKGEPTALEQAFMNYILSDEGQKMVTDKGYISEK
ncbi:MAG: phosphate ABC transporter substrate-binding protein [Eubacteriales bacterium]|nr:phosphate ABC transporter substrate-binding protein [Eubacteriales bacterium]